MDGSTQLICTDGFRKSPFFQPDKPDDPFPEKSNSPFINLQNTFTDQQSPNDVDLWPSMQNQIRNSQNQLSDFQDKYRMSQNRKSASIGNEYECFLKHKNEDKSLLEYISSSNNGNSAVLYHNNSIPKISESPKLNETAPKMQLESKINQMERQASLEEELILFSQNASPHNYSQNVAIDYLFTGSPPEINNRFRKSVSSGIRSKSPVGNNNNGNYQIDSNNQFQNYNHNSFYHHNQYLHKNEYNCTELDLSNNFKNVGPYEQNNNEYRHQDSNTELIPTFEKTQSYNTKTTRSPVFKRRKKPSRPKYSPNLASINQKKNAGLSCHQCKSLRKREELTFCTNSAIGFTKNNRVCRKKYCSKCLHKFYTDIILPVKGDVHWNCPACLDVCTCAACRRRLDKRTLVDSVDQFAFQKSFRSFQRNRQMNPYFSMHNYVSPMKAQFLSDPNINDFSRTNEMQFGEIGQRNIEKNQQNVSQQEVFLSQGLVPVTPENIPQFKRAFSTPLVLSQRQNCYGNKNGTDKTWNQEAAHSFKYGAGGDTLYELLQEERIKSSKNWNGEIDYSNGSVIKKDTMMQNFHNPINTYSNPISGNKMVNNEVFDNGITQQFGNDGSMFKSRNDTLDDEQPPPYMMRSLTCPVYGDDEDSFAHSKINQLGNSFF